MGRKPRWKRGWRNKIRFRHRQGFPRTNGNSGQNIAGGFLCLMGFGMVLAALPGWVYLLLLGGGFFAGGLLILQGGWMR